MEKPFKIGVVGVGMIGMPIVEYFLKKGYKRGKNLFCYDKNPEGGFFDDINQANVIFICVPSPSNPDGSCNTKVVESVIKKFSSKDRKSKTFIIKSTVEPGMTKKLQKKYNCNLFFNPEFLTEAKAKEDFLYPDRQIIAHTAGFTNTIQDILNTLPKADFISPNFFSNPHSIKINSSEAEIGKYGANIFGAMKVTFANILSDFCSGLEKSLSKQGVKVKVNYDNAKQVMANDKRIGGYWLDVGYQDYRGFAGYCFPKDLNAFIAFGNKLKKKLDKNDKDKILISKGLAFLAAMRDYNTTLLKSQGYNIEDISAHDKEVQFKLKNKGNNAKK